MKKGKILCRFSYFKSMANFEAVCWNISSSINFLFLKSVSIACKISGQKKNCPVKLFLFFFGGE